LQQVKNYIFESPPSLEIIFTTINHVRAPLVIQIEYLHLNFFDYFVIIFITEFAIHSMSQLNKFTRINLSEFNPLFDPGIQN
jgi:hypothetical protein